MWFTARFPFDLWMAFLGWSGNLLMHTLRWFPKGLTGLFCTENGHSIVEMVFFSLEGSPLLAVQHEGDISRLNIMSLCRAKQKEERATEGSAQCNLQQWCLHDGRHEDFGRRQVPPRVYHRFRPKQCLMVLSSGHMPGFLVIEPGTRSTINSNACMVLFIDTGFHCERIHCPFVSVSNVEEQLSIPVGRSRCPGVKTGPGMVSGRRCYASLLTYGPVVAFSGLPWCRWDSEWFSSACVQVDTFSAFSRHSRSLCSFSVMYITSLLKT